MSPEYAEILAVVSSTVASVERLPDGPHPGLRDTVERAQVTFQTCGHSYVWHDWDLSGFPKPGDVVMCAKCIDNLLESKRAS